MTDTKYTARVKLFADGAKGYRLQVRTILADNVDTGIEIHSECKAGVWSQHYVSDLGEFESLDAALKAKENRAFDDEWDAAREARI